MHNTKRKNRRFKIMTTITGFLSGSICVMVLPIFSGNTAFVHYYQIIAGENSYGCYETKEDAAKDLSEVRKKLAKQQNEPVLTSITCSIEPVEHVPKTSSQENVQTELYNDLKESQMDVMKSAYTIKVNEFTVTVDSEDAVLTTLENVKNSYDVNNYYEISLDSSDSNNCLTPVFNVREDMEMSEMQGMGFEQELQISRAFVDESEITSPEAAAAELTKEWETPTLYTVERGDCLSVIAEKHDMKTKELMELNQLTDSEYINIGDELIVTIPQPEVSVWYKVQASYEETYEAEVQYKDNSSWYTGTEKVLQEGTTGRRQVVADITYSGDKEVSREILEETLLEEAQPKIIERGTSTPPTYIKPLVGGRFSSPFGSRWGRMHKGIDWSCSVGTAVKASCGGKVVSAGWMNGYGNCITISHSDGKQTRYAHLSKILVSSGEQVKQGEKIALSGNTGNSTGPHLHFEILVNGVQVNPQKYLQ